MRGLCLWLMIGAITAVAQDLSTPYYVTGRDGAQHMNLGGQWELGYRDTPIAMPADLHDQTWVSTTLPGSVQMALYHAGKLPNPYYGMNSKLYKWVDEKVWYYRKEFKVRTEAAEENVELCFDGVDYYSRVWLNGHLLGEHQGMLGGPNIDLSEWIKAGTTNELLVEVKAANWGAKGSFNPMVPKSIIKPWSLAGGLGGEPFFSLGIWRPVRIEVLPRIHMERPFLSTESVSAEQAKLHLSVELLANVAPLSGSLHDWGAARSAKFLNSWTVQPVKDPIELEVALRDGGHLVKTERFSAKVFEGRNWVDRAFTVTKPRLWWPTGMGNAHLYSVELRLYRAGKQIDQIGFDYGIRTLRTVPSSGPRTQDFWENWQFEVNGKPFFVKGINWMAPDILYDLPRSKYEWLLEMARNAHIQLIRVWGGSFVETDDFYELCDRQGILVWQEISS